ncbi:hypothetical protein S7711_10922, partial [Stachybotrys chartarum IBT 7711]
MDRSQPTSSNLMVVGVRRFRVIILAAGGSTEPTALSPREAWATFAQGRASDQGVLMTALRPPRDVESVEIHQCQHRGIWPLALMDIRRTALANAANPLDLHNRLVADVLTRYRTLMMLATVQAEGGRNNASPEAISVAGISMKMEFDGLV